jgi:hypothetical protein
MWGRCPPIDTSHILVTSTWSRRHDLNNTQPSDHSTTTTITTTTTNSSPPTLQPLYYSTTLLPALHIRHEKQLAQLTSAAAPDITTATGRTFITYQSSKCRFLNDRVRASACSLASSSHSAGRAFTTTTAWLIALSSSLTDDCLLVLTWDYARTTRHATPRRRTPTKNFQHLWHQTSLYGSGNKCQVPLSQHTTTRLPDNLNRNFESLYASKCSIIISVSIYPNHAFRSSCPLPRTLQHPSNNLSEGVMWGNAHIAGFPRASTPPEECRRSYISRTIATVRARHETRLVSLQQLHRVQHVGSFVSSAVTGPTVCSVNLQANYWCGGGIRPSIPPPICVMTSVPEFICQNLLIKLFIHFLPYYISMSVGTHLEQDKLNLIW